MAHATKISSEKLTKKNRIISSQHYKNVFEARRKTQSRYFIMYARESDGEEMPRLGLAISKKNIKRAVARNRIKRLVRESFRKNMASGIDVVVMCKKNADLAANHLLLEDLMESWTKLNTS
ncbi:MAG: ribonuclease P protein component [Pseudomonadota bacterium]